MEKRPIITALLAYGMSGKVFHAPFLATNDGFELKAVLERNEKKAVLDFPNIVSFHDVDALLSDDSIELVVINTPNFTHFEYAQKALLAHKHILIEKPAVTTVAEFKTLQKQAKEVGKKIFVYHNRRWSSDFMATKEVIESGVLGEIVEMHLRFDRFRPAIGPKAFKETPVPGSGIWYDLGSHLIDQAISIFGLPTHHYGYQNHYRANAQVSDFGFMHLQFNKTNVFITTSLMVADAQAGIVVHGTKGSFVKEFCDTQEAQLIEGRLPSDPDFGREPKDKEGILTIVAADGSSTKSKITSKKGRFNDFFDAVYQNIRHQETYPITDEDILKQLELLS
jgi:predicted dehydrogenase